MALSHHSKVSLRTTDRTRGEGGYVLAMFGLLLVPLLLMAGFSVDVGSWYSRASNLQKAADAASLAGVVWLPDEVMARSVALDVAKRNGFDNADPNITVSVLRSQSSARRLNVRITDNRVGSFFYSNLGGNDIKLSRVGTSEYILPVPLGSPENQFGGVAGKSDPVGSNAPGLWGNIHGPQTDSKKGDAFNPECRGSGDSGCTTSQLNPTRRTTGYLYTIDVPAGVVNMNVEVYDAGLYHRGTDESVGTGDRDYTNNASRTTTTVWTLYNRDSSELDVTDNQTAADSGICTTGPGIWTLAQGANATIHQDKWASLCQVGGGVTPGRYLLKVEAKGNGNSANRYAIRAKASSAAQPRISAYGDMSMFNNIGTGNANFYLAEVDPVHRGKTLQLRLYDPGEVSGNATMKILTPGGTVAPTCVGLHDGGSGSSATFTSGANLSPCQFNSSVNGAKFDGLWVTLQIKIPNDYSCTLGTLPGCWWKIRYEISGQATDTTTWSAEIIGDPIHLVEEN